MTEKQRTAPKKQKTEASEPPKDKRDAGHKLWIWMQDNGYNDYRFGVAIRPDNPVSKRTVFRWLTEGREPELDLVQRIYDFTDGYVGLMDWPTAYKQEKAAALEAAMKPKRKGKGKT